MLAAAGARPAQAANLHGVLLLGVVDDYRSDAAKAGVLGQNDVDDDTRSHSGVGGVATLFQDAVSRRRGQVVTGRHHVSGSGD